MHEDMRKLLNAYLDGELHGRRLLEMQAHLASCEACQIELKELRLVSDLLQASSAPEALPAERFVSQLTLSLPRSASAGPVAEVQLTGRVARPGGIARSLVLCADGIRPHQHGHCGKHHRPAGECRSVGSVDGRRQSGSVRQPICSADRQSEPCPHSPC